jgi:hypothetical protein
VKKGSERAQSLVYWAGVFVVDPRADRRGDVAGWGAGPARMLDGFVPVPANSLGYIL